MAYFASYYLNLHDESEYEIFNILIQHAALLQWVSECLGSDLAFFQLLVRRQKARPATRYALNSESGNARSLALFKIRQ
ncbi:protein of unknown function [Legionella fallonii LLAP-10]|uniref:Uncharacterized protein n=1 Tax=Legionella fallonii LLAP-10 TaxID=1212491 RepID=A0A098G5P1_9GAMM|nr:protein of unknown function [Legionella fallonii LLAP-10]